MFDFISTALSAVEPTANAIQAFADGLTSSVCKGPVGNFIAPIREPFAKWWVQNQGVIDLAVTIAQSPPLIAVGFVAEPLAFVGSLVESCKITEATADRACSFVNRMLIVEPIVRHPWLMDATRGVAGNTGAAVLSALGSVAGASRRLAQPFCQNRFPKPEDVFGLMGELANLAQQVQQAGGPNILSYLGPVLEPALGPAYECMKEGKDAKACIDAAIAAAQQPPFEVTLDLSFQAPSPSPSPSSSPSQAQASSPVVPALALFALSRLL